MDLFRHGDRIDEGLSANLNYSPLEDVYLEFDLFGENVRRSMSQWIKKSPNYVVIIKGQNFTIDASGLHSSAKIFNISEPLKEINLNTSSYQKATITQRPDGIEYVTKMEGENLVIRFYSNHLISQLNLWTLLRDDSFILADPDFYFYLSKPYVANCSPKYKSS